MPKLRTDEAIAKIGLVSQSYQVKGRMDFKHAAAIHAECDRRQCDTVLYALHSWKDHGPVERTRYRLFGKTKRLHTIILDTSESPDQPAVLEMWTRGRRRPFRYEQQAIKRPIPSQQISLLLDLESRWFQHGQTIIPGKVSNLLGMDRRGQVTDRGEARIQFTSMCVGTILNPSHERWQRHESPQKLAYLTRKGRAVVSVWCTTKPSDRPPWRVAYDGNDYTDAVEEVPMPFKDRPDIRVGVLAVNLLWTI